MIVGNKLTIRCGVCQDYFTLTRRTRTYCSERCRKIARKSKCATVKSQLAKLDQTHKEVVDSRKDRVAMLQALAARGLPLELPREVGVTILQPQLNTNTTVPSSCSQKEEK